MIEFLVTNTWMFLLASITFFVIAAISGKIATQVMEKDDIYTLGLFAGMCVVAKRISDICLQVFLIVIAYRIII